MASRPPASKSCFTWRSQGGIPGMQRQKLKSSRVLAPRIHTCCFWHILLVKQISRSAQIQGIEKDSISGWKEQQSHIEKGPGTETGGICGH